jgi:hypothetical protein
LIVHSDRMFKNVNIETNLELNWKKLGEVFNFISSSGNGNFEEVEETVRSSRRVLKDAQPYVNMQRDSTQ